MSLLEIVSNILNLMGVLLAARNSVWTWPVGIAGCTLYIFMFFDVKLYADMTLQFFYIATAVYGWYLWKKGGAKEDELPITKTESKQFFKMSALALLVTALYGTLLHQLTDASYPFIDSLIMSFSILGQLLMMKRKIECWPVWILVNTLSIPLFLSKGLYLTAFVYGLFWVSAIWGHIEWKKQGRGIHP